MNLIQSAHGAASLAAGAVDAKVAIVGAGAAGLCAAHELMRVGLTPVIFEAQPRLGGRCHTYSFQGDPKAFAELGAMRIPFSQQSVFHYLEELGVKARQAAYLVEGEWPTFPSPKQVDTRFYFRGSNFAFVACDGAYIGDGQVIQRVSAIEAKFNALLARDLEALQELDRAYSGGNGLSAAKYQEYVGRRLALWSNVVDAYQDKSLFEVLKEYRGTMGSWSTDDIEMLGAIGLGTGGIGAIYNTAYLETLRESYHRDDRDMRTIVGGVSQITDALWSARRARAHGLGQASVAELNQGQFHRRVTAIRTPDDPRNAIEVTYAENGEAKSAHFPAVIVSCSLRGLEMGIEFNREAFADEVWYAIRNFGMVSSQKVFVRTKTPFWKRWNADNAGDPLKQIVTTISDTTTRQSYFLDARLFGEGRQTPAGVALLSYSWASNAVKFNALSDEQKVRIGLDNLAEIYGREITDRFEEEIEEVRSINWDLEEGFGDAFRQANAGQYEQHRVLFQQGLGQSGSDNGLYLAGEALAWYGLSGWIEGALHTGINAALATIGRLNRLPEATLSAVG